jgi:LytR cell envelope-related transcriptional attenuator
VEHVQPLHRPYPWRTVALAASVLALAAGSVVALLHRPQQTRPAAVTRRVQNTPTPPPLRPRSETSVLVLNGNGVSGAAGTLATSVLAHGYRHAIPADAPSLHYARSLVLFRPGWQREAERLARDSRIPTVAPLDGRVAPQYAHVPLLLILGAN